MTDENGHEWIANRTYGWNQFCVFKDGDSAFLLEEDDNMPNYWIVFNDAPPNGLYKTRREYVQALARSEFQMERLGSKGWTGSTEELLIWAIETYNKNGWTEDEVDWEDE